jgi:drug/metabolite transporter (DMT)-like permease
MLYVASMRTISPTISALLILLEVVVASILSVLIFRDPLDGFTLAGGALILVGAYVVTRGEKTLAESGAGLGVVTADPSLRDPDDIVER